MKNLFIVLIVGLSISSCTFSQQSKLLERNNYIIPDSLLSYFPDKSDKYNNLKLIKVSENATKMEVPLYLSRFSPVRLLEAYQCGNQESLQFLIKEYRSQSLFSIRSDDKNYFVIGSERELSNKYDSLQLKGKYSKQTDKSIVFYFKESLDDIPFLYDATTISCLPAGYEIIVLKSGNEFVLPKDNLYDWSVLPETLKHGYRSGVAFKEEEPYIIYWTVAW